MAFQKNRKSIDSANKAPEMVEAKKPSKNQKKSRSRPIRRNVSPSHKKGVTGSSGRVHKPTPQRLISDVPEHSPKHNSSHSQITHESFSIGVIQFFLHLGNSFVKKGDSTKGKSSH